MPAIAPTAALACGLLAAWLPAPPALRRPPPLPSPPAVGAALDAHGYRARYRLVTVGQVVGHAEVWLGPISHGGREGPTRTLHVEARTEGTFGRLVPAAGVYEATLDAATLTPRRTSLSYRRPRRGARRGYPRAARTRLTFDPPRGTVTRARAGRASTLPAAPGTHDPLSWMLALAARRPAPGDRLSFGVMTQNRRVRVTVQVDEARRVGTPSGLTRALRAAGQVLVWWPEPRLAAGAPHRPRRAGWAITVWLDPASPSGLPVRVDTSLSWAGPLRVELERMARLTGEVPETTPSGQQ